MWALCDTAMERCEEGRLSMKSTGVELQTMEKLCNPESVGFMAH